MFSASTGKNSLRQTVTNSAFCLTGAAALAVACSSGGDVPGNPDCASPESAGAAIDAGDCSHADSPADLFLGVDAVCQLPADHLVHTLAPTYHAVYQEILGPTCGVEFCHGGTADYLQLWTESGGYPSLVAAPAQGPACAPTGLLRVDPGHPETSLLYLKLTSSPPCGNRMPLQYGCAGGLDSREVEQIRSWIACGALAGDAGCAGVGDAAGSTAADAGADAD